MVLMDYFLEFQPRNSPRTWEHHCQRPLLVERIQNLAEKGKTKKRGELPNPYLSISLAFHCQALDTLALTTGCANKTLLLTMQILLSTKILGTWINAN